MQETLQGQHSQELETVQKKGIRAKEIKYNTEVLSLVDWPNKGNTAKRETSEA